MSEQNSTSMEALQVTSSENSDHSFRIPNSRGVYIEGEPQIAQTSEPNAEYAEKLPTISEAYERSRAIVAFRKFEDDSQIILDEAA